MSGHTPWSEIKHKSDKPLWVLAMYRRYRPWWGLGLIVRRYDLVASHGASEEAVLAKCSELEAQFPKWDLELRRAK